jgi:hypothetical protein
VKEDHCDLGSILCKLHRNNSSLLEGITFRLFSILLFLCLSWGYTAKKQELNELRRALPRLLNKLTDYITIIKSVIYIE